MQLDVAVMRLAQTKGCTLHPYFLPQWRLLAMDISDSDSLLETAPADTELRAETIAVARHRSTLGAWPIA